MLKSLKSNSYRFVVVLLLLLTFLTTGMVGKVIPSYALAQEITPEIEPVYDTEVVSLQDYVDNVLTDAQVAVFNILLGSYVASQAGLNEYDLEYPYTDRSGIIGWLQNAGMKLYNDIISLGQYDLVTGTDLRTYILRAASYAIGMAQKAHTYTDMNDFLDDVDNNTHYFVPIDPVLQASINAYFGRKGGLWDWQFNALPFETNVTWKSIDMGGYVTSYNSYLSTFTNPVKGNETNYTARYGLFNINFSIDQKYDLFINTSNSRAYLVDNNGNLASQIYVPYLAYYKNGGNTYLEYRESVLLTFYQVNFSSFTYSNYVDLVNQLLNPNDYSSDSRLLAYFYHNFGNFNGALYPFFGDIIDHVYAGLNWATKQEVFNLTDLNFAQNESPSYYEVPNNSYIDLKGFLTDIVNNTNILNVILNNLFKPDGTLNVDPALVKVSITIPDTNPLPVNLNDIQIYTDNEYLDIVKQRALQASETIGEYVAFWHNCDSELVYAILGSFIVILIGAFIGKWGHS